MEWDMSQEHQQYNIMALPAMITDFGAQQANYGAAVGQSLAQLGQQVGQQLAMREYQKQAAAALPAMQASYKSAFDKMGQGKYADGYMELLNTNLQFGATTNPFIAQFAEQANQTAKQMESALWREAQYNRTTPRGPIPAMGPSGAATAMGRLYGNAPMETTETVTTDTVTTSNPPGQPTATLLPPGAPIVEPDSMPEGDTGADFNQPVGEMVGVGEEGPDEVQIDAANAAAQAVDATPEMQTKAVNALVADPKDSKIQWQNDKVEGLSALFPKSNLTDNIAIAPVGSTVEYSETWSGDTNKAGARFSGNKQVKVDDALNKKAVEYAGKLQESVSKLYNTGPADTDQTWADVIKDAGGIQNLIPASAGADDFSIRIKGKKSLPVNKDTFEAFERVKGFSAFASRTGIKVMREGGEATADLRSRRFGSVEEADASGLPKGTIVYILRDGKYKKARID
jgi:hypothetical protein